MKRGSILLLAFLLFLTFLPSRAYSSRDRVIEMGYNQLQNKSMRFLSTFVNVSETNPIADKGTINGEIDPEIFSRSIPKQMILGRIYRAVVVVRNTGSDIGRFTLVVSSPIDYVISLMQEGNETNFYMPDEIVVHLKGNIAIFSLEPGDQHIFEFPVMALQSHVGVLYITASLFTITKFEETIELSKAIAEIREIKTIVPSEWITFLIILISAISGIFFMKRLKPPILDVLIIVSLFAVSIMLRWHDILRVSLYPDEVTYMRAGVSVLLNDWTWSKNLMLGYPPLFFYLSAVLVHIFGPQLHVLRAISVVFGSLSVCIVYLLGKELFDRRVGLLSAVFLSLSSFHILYSRILMTEGLEIFLILMSVLFFVKGYLKQKNNVYLCASGVFIGLSISTKYLALTIYIALILLLLWTHRSWKFLFKKDFLLIVFVSLIVFLPTLVSLALNRANPIWYWMNLPFQEPTRRSIPIFELIIRGYENYMNLIMRGMQSLSWAPSYLIISSIFLFAAVFYNFIGMLKSHKNESLLICFFAVNALTTFLFPLRHIYYLLYSIPFYYIMLSHFGISCGEIFRSRGATSKPVKFLKALNLSLMKIFVLSLIGILFFSHSAVGILETLTDRGEFDGYRQVSSFIKTRIHPGEVVGAILSPLFQYYFSRYNINCTLIELIKVVKFVEPMKGVFLDAEYKFDSDTLKVCNPRYILTSGLWYERILKGEDRKEILASYRVVFKSTVKQGEEAPLALERF